MPIRIQRRRTKGWKMPDNTVYVGRPSKWGNPFPHDTVNLNRVELFEIWIKNKPQLQKDVVKELKGKNLSCWCKDDNCHAMILLKIANQ